VDPDMARSIVSKLPRDIECVGVFVSGFDSDIPTIVDRVGLTGMQLHVGLSIPGDKMQPGLESSNGIKKYLALSVSHFLEHRGQFDSFATSPRNEALKWAGILLDSGTQEQPGGTGQTFEWSKAVPIADVIKRLGLNLVVAGGLTSNNVGEAIRVLEPWGVDVSSGVEAKPGKKDPAKVRDFIAAVRLTERAV